MMGTTLLRKSLEKVEGEKEEKGKGRKKERGYGKKQGGVGNE